MSRMSNLARMEMYFGRTISLDEIAAAIDAVSSDEILEIAREFFDSSLLALTILGPLNGFKISREDLVC